MELLGLNLQRLCLGGYYPTTDELLTLDVS
jgi:hypothetical protein